MRLGVCEHVFKQRHQEHKLFEFLFVLSAPVLPVTLFSTLSKVSDFIGSGKFCQVT